MSDTWRPGISPERLHQAARLRSLVRDYFAAEGVLEVDTPALSAAGNPDPAIQSFPVADAHAGTRWLQTSPEFAMKRLLAAHAEDIYQIAHAFRQGESGRHHNTEFQMLEWYRCGFDHLALIDDVLALLQHLWRGFGKAWQAPSCHAYADLVEAVAGARPQQLDVEAIRQVFRRRQRSFPLEDDDGVDAALDLLIDEFVLVDFPADRVSVILDYPASQAALARLDRNARGEPVARRFEVYVGAVELANGFHELTDPIEQKQRFIDDNQRRAEKGLASMPIDTEFLAALAAGLPDCAGVALGLDRVLMLLTGASRLSEVMTFSDANA